MGQRILLMKEISFKPGVKKWRINATSSDSVIQFEYLEWLKTLFRGQL